MLLRQGENNRVDTLWSGRSNFPGLDNQGNLGRLRSKRENLGVIRKAKTRRWERLDISFPVFARGLDDHGNEFVEFGTALNVSAGGMLLAVRKAHPHGRLRLEIPNPPWLAAPGSHRAMEASTVWAQPRDRFTLLGLKFRRPLQKLKSPGDPQNDGHRSGSRQK